MPILRCHGFATTLAIFCHRIGKAVPSHWQSIAKPLAKQERIIGMVLDIDKLITDY